MSKRTKYVVGTAAVVVGALWLSPFSVMWTLIALVAVPVVAYMALDKSQRKRLRRVTRKELNR
jgi:membrane protein implicated in regulation of membrane protease activity